MSIHELSEKYPEYSRTLISTRLQQLEIKPPPRPTPLSKQPFPELKRAYEAGDSLGDLARKHGVAESTISNMLEELGVPRRPRGTRKPTNNDAALIDDFNRGLGYRQMAKRQGLTVDKLMDKLEELGLETWGGK